MNQIPDVNVNYPMFFPNGLFVATWIGVRNYNSNYGEEQTFQIAILSENMNLRRTIAILNYDYLYGGNENVFMGVGYSSTYWQHPYSGYNEYQLKTNLMNGGSATGQGYYGRWVIRIDEEYLGDHSVLNYVHPPGFYPDIVTQAIVYPIIFTVIMLIGLCYGCCVCCISVIVMCIVNTNVLRAKSYGEDTPTVSEMEPQFT